MIDERRRGGPSPLDEEPSRLARTAAGTRAGTRRPASDRAAGGLAADGTRFAAGPSPRSDPRSGSGRGAPVGEAAVARLQALGHRVDLLRPADAAAAEHLAADVVRESRARTPGRPRRRRRRRSRSTSGANVVAGTGSRSASSRPAPATTWPVPGACPSDPVAAVDTIDACVRLRSHRLVDAGPRRAGRRRRRRRRAGWQGWSRPASTRWSTSAPTAGGGPAGAARYNLAIARELPLFRPVPYRLVLDGEVWRHRGPAGRGGQHLLLRRWHADRPGRLARRRPARRRGGHAGAAAPVRPALPAGLRRHATSALDAVEVRRARAVEVHVDACRPAPAPDRRLRRRGAAGPAGAPFHRPVPGAAGCPVPARARNLEACPAPQNGSLRHG